MPGKGLYRPVQEGIREEGTLASSLWQRAELRLQVEEEAGPLWPRLGERLAAIPERPRLRAGLVLKAAPSADRPTYLLADLASGRRFRLGEREAAVLPLLDGSRDVAQIVQDYPDRWGGIAAPAVERFLQDLRSAGLLDEGSSLWQRLSSPERGGPVILWSLSQAEEKLAALHRRLRFLFHPLAWMGVLALLLGAITLLILRREVLGNDVAVLLSSSWAVLFLLAAFYAAMMLVILTHELAHALTCTHFGGRVSHLGLMVRHWLPAAFADVSDIYFFPKRARLATFLSGPASTAVWAALAAALWAWTPAGSWVHLLSAAVMLASFLSLLVGLNPVGGYDGTDMLAEWLETPDLHRKALIYGWNRLRGRAPSVPPRQKRILGRYGLAFLGYNLTVIGLVTAVLLCALLR